MIYFDNSATTFIKPPQIAESVIYALNNFGNAGRSFYDYAVNASRAIYDAREAIGQIVGAEDPLSVAFTSSATESMNLVLYGILNSSDHVITTVCEHNSVLRPLYNIGCEISFIKCDENGRLILDDLEKNIKENTKCVVCTHGSNLTGNITDTDAIKSFCKSNELLLILDVAQTLGFIETKSSFADIVCFTGHKGLFGPQGTGGIICESLPEIRTIKTGGTGGNSFDKLQPKRMPDIFEAGTLNGPGIYGLYKGCQYVLDMGIDAIFEKSTSLSNSFIEGIKNIEGITFYGDYDASKRLPIVSINLNDISSDELSFKLWEKYSIATRSGIHCAPLIHQHFGTESRGIVRFSFSHLNEMEEIEIAIDAIKSISSTSS